MATLTIVYAVYAYTKQSRINQMAHTDIGTPNSLTAHVTCPTGVGIGAHGTGQNLERPNRI